VAHVDARNPGANLELPRDLAQQLRRGKAVVIEDLAERMRPVLAGTGAVAEVKMFGGLCFMLYGNMVAGTSRRGLLVRVGKDQHAHALARPDAKPMEMSGRLMEGYIIVDPPPHDERALRDWLEIALAFVKTLQPKPPKSKLRRAAGRTPVR
jgi:TfoX/Sxy family transcriptional regulator of competence genes